MGRLFRIAVVCSSALCLVVLFLWVRSYWRMDKFVWLGSGDKNTVWNNVCAACGEVQVERRCLVNDIFRDWGIKTGFSSTQLTTKTTLIGWVDEPRSDGTFVRPNGLIWSFRFAGFDGFAERGTNGADWMAVVPLWFPAALTAILPGCLLYRLRRARRRAAKGLCQRCGYDLRSSPERCPECGSPVPAPAEPSTGIAP